MASDTVHVVVIDTRTPVGVAQLPDTMWLNVGKAKARAREINDDPKRFPNMVAWTVPYKIVGGKLTEVRPRHERRGEGNGAAKLNEASVREARQRRREGESTRQLADYYGVSPRAMSDALCGITWAHVI